MDRSRILVNHTSRYFSKIERLPSLCVSVAVLFSLSCSDGSSPIASGGAPASMENQPPVITAATILNDPIRLDGPVTVQVYADDPEREAVAFEYQWYVDDVPLPKQTNAMLSTEVLERGQMVMVEIVPKDGMQRGQAYRTKSVVVGNTPPQVMAVALVPQTVRPGDRIDAQVEARDPDRDRVDLTYKWFRNEALLKEGEESFLDTTGFVSQDTIVVEVTGRDPDVSGKSLRSEPLVLGNSAPKIVSTPPAPGAKDHFEYLVQAVDSDGDKVTYRLEAAPPGMTINEQSGHIRWPFPTDRRGTFQVRVVAQDSSGGVAYQEFDLTLSIPPPIKPAKS